MSFNIKTASSNAKFAIEKWEHGWVLCSSGRHNGVPMDALDQCGLLFQRGSYADTGIVHHLRATKKSEKAVLCIVLPEQSKKWHQEIEAELASFDREERWWYGLDVGCSSTVIFAVLNENKRLTYDATESGGKSIPHDADDFGRCKRLLDMFPEWRTRLDSVAKAHQDTCWPAIIARWQELEAASKEDQTKILAEIIDISKRLV
jgi:hypothetical protein